MLPGLATTRTHQVFWKSWLGSRRLGSMLQVWRDVDSKETSAGVRSGCVWVCAIVPLWACWWHHKPLNQCFTAPRHSGGFCKVLQTKTERILSSAVWITQHGSPTSLCDYCIVALSEPVHYNTPQKDVNAYQWTKVHCTNSHPCVKC